jgi:hypothetical protein
MKDRKEYMKAYYQANKPTKEERFLMREAYREKRKVWNKTSRERLKQKKAMVNGNV